MRTPVLRVVAYTGFCVCLCNCGCVGVRRGGNPLDGRSRPHQEWQGRDLYAEGEGSEVSPYYTTILTEMVRHLSLFSLNQELRILKTDYFFMSFNMKQCAPWKCSVYLLFCSPTLCRGIYILKYRSMLLGGKYLNSITLYCYYGKFKQLCFVYFLFSLPTICRGVLIYWTIGTGQCHVGEKILKWFSFELFLRKFMQSFFVFYLFCLTTMCRGK